MKKLFKDKKGVSLIWVLILLIVVGGLSAALLSSAVFNINFGSDEVNTSRAFYAAEAGVERTKADVFSRNVSNIEDYHISGALDYDSNFEFSYEVKYNSDKEIFESVGYRGDSNLAHEDRKNVQKIEFDLIRDALVDIAVLINKYGSEAIDDYVNFRGQEKDFGRDNIGLVDMGKWEDFLFLNYGIYLDDQAGITFYENQEDVPENILDEYENEELKEWIHESFGQWEINDMSRINQPLIENKYWYLTNERVELGDGAIEWVEKSEFLEGDYSYIYQDEIYYYYESLEDHDATAENKPGEGEEWEDKWDFVGQSGEADGDLDFGGNVTIEDSIMVIDGSTKMLGNVTLKNSLILVKNDIEFGGSYDLDESLIVSFNEEGKSLVTTGNPSIDLTKISISEELWPGIGELIDKLKDNLFEFVLTNWRQVR